MKRVKARITYQCGRCNNLVRRDVVADPDGLLELKNMVCGRCARHNNFTPLSVVISGVVVEETNEPAKEAGLLGRDEVSAELVPPVPPGKSQEGRKPADEAGDRHPESETGEPGVAGLPSMPPAKKVASRPAE